MNGRNAHSKEAAEAVAHVVVGEERLPQRDGSHNGLIVGPTEQDGAVL